MKLKAVILDDDPFYFTVIRDFCKNSPLIEITQTFDNPVEFVNAVPKLDFDLCFLDIFMGKMDGIQVSQVLKDKAIIYITGTFTRLADALQTPHIDVILKPIREDKLFAAIEAAYSAVFKRRVPETDHKFFSVAGDKAKVNIKLSDIFLVETDKENNEHKHVFLRNGRKNTVTNCPLDEFLKIVPGLKQPNKSELVAKEAVAHIRYNRIIILNGIIKNGKPREVTLSRFYRKSFLK